MRSPQLSIMIHADVKPEWEDHLVESWGSSVVSAFSVLSHVHRNIPIFHIVPRVWFSPQGHLCIWWACLWACGCVMQLRKLSRETKWWQRSEISCLWELGTVLVDLGKVQLESVPSLHTSDERHFWNFREKISLCGQVGAENKVCG